MIRGDMIAYQTNINSVSYTNNYVFPVLSKMSQELKNLYKELNDKLFSQEVIYHTFYNTFQVLGGTRNNIWNIEIRNLVDTSLIITPDLYEKFTVKKNGSLIEKIKSIINEEQKKGFLGYKSFNYRLKEYIEKSVPNKEEFVKQIEIFANKPAKTT